MWTAEHAAGGTAARFHPDPAGARPCRGRPGLAGERAINLDPRRQAAKDAQPTMKIAAARRTLEQKSVAVRRGRQRASALFRAALVVTLAGGCAARPVAATAVPASAAANGADAEEGAAVPFALCRSFGAGGTPCYPTHVDVGSRPVSPCRDRQRGHCELSGPRHIMACLLSPLADGKACGAGGVCRDGSCVRE